MSSQEDRYEGHDTLADHEGVRDEAVSDEQAQRDSVFGRHQSVDGSVDESADAVTTTDGEPVRLDEDTDDSVTSSDVVTSSDSVDSGRPDDDRPFGFGHLTSSDPVVKDVSADDSSVDDASIKDDEIKDVDATDVDASDVTASDVSAVPVVTDDKADEVDEVDEVDDKDFDEDDKADAVPETDVTPISSAETVTGDPVVVADPVPPVAATTAIPADTAASTPAATSPSPSVSAEWLELQGKFVDDPVAAVREAGSKVEQALADLRSKVETGSTEDLRTAFRRYRDLHATLR